MARRARGAPRVRTERWSSCACRYNIDMSISTIFFAAPPSSVDSWFRGWSPPKRVTKKVVNAFTDKTLTIRLLVPESGDGPSAARLPSRTPQFERKFLLPYCLRPLLGGCDDGWPEGGAELLAVQDAKAKDKPTKSLVDPILMRSLEETLHLLPSVLVTALAALKEERAKKLARAWSKALVAAEVPYALSPGDAALVLVELSKLSRAASGNGLEVFAHVR